MDRENKAYTNLQNVPIKSEIDYEDIDCSIIKEELEVGPTVLEERHVDTVLFEVSEFKVMDGSKNIQNNNNNTYLEELSHSKIKNKTQQTKKVKRKRVFNNQNKEVEHKEVCNSHRVNTTWDALYTKNGKFRSFTCDQCPYRTSVKMELNRHKNIHTGQNLYKCSICDYKTPFKSRHTRHQAVHSGVKSFFCDVCNYKTGTKENLTRHMGTHAPKLGVSRLKYPCNKCDKEFTTKASATKHIVRMHTVKLSYWCTHCDFKAKDRRMIVRHINNHTGWKPYSCDKCGIRYRGSESVIRHRRIYHKENI